jgi:hypothetical protein
MTTESDVRQDAADYPTESRQKPANVLRGMATSNVKQYSCFRSKLI